ncbi:hypothetical protein CRE_18428 [Caenorhabditis remanei]|uniref:Uncharacterized protein n=1 Tax=Caenorhabditis remanei TaxID=31234 RepID=E3LK98_CAERE|nr:hypothetical protein CRE_18428 [Caenorhabditis remanei]
MESSVVSCSSLSPSEFSNNSILSITSSVSQPDDFPEKCQICFQQGHGYHFGVFACRACAAFFRRCHFSAALGQRKCRLMNGQCGPNRNGRWFCKKCRMDRCIQLGMTTTNIQYDRDAFKSSSNFLKNQALAKMVGDRIGVPITVESILGLHHLISFIPMSGEVTNLPFVDTSQLVDKALTILLTPNLVRKNKKTSNLEQLKIGLEEFQSEQKENLSEIVYLSQNDQKREFETNMCAAARWMSCSDQIRQYDDDMKISLLQAVWFVWGRFERIWMTAKMRSKKLCGKKQFVVSQEALIDYDRMDSDISCWSNHTFEEMKFFFVPRELYYDDVIWELMEVQPDDVELTFIMSSLCFQLTGKRHGERVQEEMERLEDIFSNELHEYYTRIKKPMYLLRLKQLMRVKEKFLKIRNTRIDKYQIGGIFNMFNVSFSNPDFFWVPP